MLTIRLKTLLSAVSLLCILTALIVVPIPQANSQTFGPRLDQIYGRFVQGPAAQAAMLYSDVVNIWFDIRDPVLVRDLADNDFTMSVAPETFLFDYIAFNMRDQENPSGGGDPWRTESAPGEYYTYSGLQYKNYVPLNDTAFRHALAHCIPKDEIVATVYGGISAAAISSVVPKAQREWYNPGVDGHSFNPGDPTANTTYPQSHDACSILRAAGYVWGNATAPNPAPKYSPTDPDGNWLDPHTALAADNPGTLWNDTLGSPMNHITFAGVAEAIAPHSYGRDDMCLREFRAIGLPIQHVTPPIPAGGNMLVEEWRYPMFYYPLDRLPFGSSPAIADLGPIVNNNGTEPDSDLELATGSDEYYNYYWELGNTARGIWRCLDSGGNLEWALNTKTDQSRSSPAIIDIDGDGDLEIAAGTTSGWYVEVMNHTGGFVWTFPTQTANYVGGPYAWPSSPAVVDVNSTVAGLEVIIGNRHLGNVWAFDGDNTDGIDDGITITSADFPGFPYPLGVEGTDWDVLWKFDTLGEVFSSPAVGDADNDGVLEVVIGSTDGNVYVLDGRNGSLEHAFLTGDGVYASAAVANLDGDAFLEMVIGSTDGKIYCFQWTGAVGTTEWTYSTGDAIYSSAAIGDIDNDGSLEIVVGSNDTKVYALGGGGGWPTSEWNFTTGDAVYSSPAIAQPYNVNPYDKDWPMFRNNPNRTGVYGQASSAHLRIYVGSDDGYLYSLDGNTGSLIDSFRAYNSSSGGIHTSPSVADIDGDSKLEILFYDWGTNSTRNGHTFWCIEDTGTPQNIMNLHRFDMYAAGWKVGRLPDHLYGFFHSSQDMIDGYNFPGINDTELDAKLETVQFSWNSTAVKQACFDAQDMIAEKLPYIVTVTRSLVAASAAADVPGLMDTLKGVVNSPVYGPENDYTFCSLHWESNIIETTNPYGIGGTVQYIVGSTPTNYHPGYASTGDEWMILGRIFDGLININPYTHEDIPWLATSWTIEDWNYSGSPDPADLGMKTTFWLRNDVYWHDGVQFTAYDVEFGLEFARDQQIARAFPMWQHLVDVEVLNNFMVSVYHDAKSLWVFYQTAGPNVWLVNDAACWATMFPKHIYQTTGAAFRPELAINPLNPNLTCLIGTGPFVYQGGPLGWGGFANLSAYRPEASPVTTQWWMSVQGYDGLVEEQFHWIGDCNRDGIIDIYDLTLAALAYATTSSDPRYDPMADTSPEPTYHTNDGRVDMRDLIELSANWGKQRDYA